MENQIPPSIEVDKQSQNNAKRIRSDASGWSIAMTFCGLLATIFIFYTWAEFRANAIAKAYAFQGLDIAFKCLAAGALACGLIGITAYFTRSRDTLWFYYIMAIALCLLAIFIDDWRPLFNFRRWS